MSATYRIDALWYLGIKMEGHTEVEPRAAHHAKDAENYALASRAGTLPSLNKVKNVSPGTDTLTDDPVVDLDHSPQLTVNLETITDVRDILPVLRISAYSSAYSSALSSASASASACRYSPCGSRTALNVVLVCGGLDIDAGSCNVRKCSVTFFQQSGAN